MINVKIIRKEAICNPYGTYEFYNANLYHAEESYKMLKKVYNKEIPFISDIYSIFVNTLERFYKGIIEEGSDLSGMDIDNMVQNTHRLENLFDYIDDYFFSIQPENINLEKLYEKLKTFSDGYTRSKYKDIYEYSDFVKGFEFLEAQRELIFKEFEKFRIKEEEKYKD